MTSRDAGLRRCRETLLAVELLEDGCARPNSPQVREYLRFHADRYDQTLALIQTEVASLGPQARILEVGASTWFSTLVQATFPEASLRGVEGGHAIDPLPGDLPPTRTVETSLRGRRYAWEVDRCNLEREALPYPDDSFDLVLFLEVLEHLILGPLVALKEIGRVLRPGGRLILTTDNSNSFIKLAKLLLMRPIYWPYPEGNYGSRHNREYLPREVRELLTGIGYADVRVETFNMLPYLPGDSLPKYLGYQVGNALTRLPLLRLYQRHIAARATCDAVRDYRPDWLYV